MFLLFKMLEVDSILSLSSRVSNFPLTHGLDKHMCPLSSDITLLAKF